MARRILIAGLHHEGNHFTSLLTRRDNCTISQGQSLSEKATRSGAGIGGAYRLLKQRGCEIIPALSAIAPPGGPFETALYEDLRDRIVTAAAQARPDGVYLDLHGAMLVETECDPEGDLIARLRDALGPSVPIAVSLDLHACVTDRMLANADIIVACKENPHSDYDLAGARAAELLLATLDGRIRAVTAAVFVPFVFGCRMETAKGPLRALHDKRRAICAKEPTVLDISIYNAHTLVDFEKAWQCVTVITDDDPELAGRVAHDIARDLWTARDEFTPEFLPLDDVLGDLRAGKLPRPLILGDQGDRVLAGTPGDGTFILAKLATEYPDLRAVVPLTDPQTVAAAKAAGAGAILRGHVGGTLSRGVPAYEGEWRVERIGDGTFVQAGPFLAGEPAKLGDTAVLRQGNLVLLVTSLPGFSQDREAFRSQGIYFADFDVIVSKSGYHFKLSFDEVGTCLVVDTPGISNYRPGLLPYKRRRPIYPEDKIETVSFAPSIYAGARQRSERPAS